MIEAFRFRNQIIFRDMIIHIDDVAVPKKILVLEDDKVILKDEKVKIIENTKTLLSFKFYKEIVSFDKRNNTVNITYGV